MSTPKKIAAIYQLKITLRDIEPPIWRRVQVSEDTRLPRLHRILQLLFNWEDYHLHEFVTARRRIYGVPAPDGEEFGRTIHDEKLVPLNRIIDWVGGTVEYHYDFGDNWRHAILLEAILLPDADGAYPRCTAGARNGPPEDTGGTSGYDTYLGALADAEHEEHEDMLAWRGPFDPEAFSLARINASLRKSFAPRRRKTVAANRLGPEARP